MCRQHHQDTEDCIQTRGLLTVELYDHVQMALAGGKKEGKEELIILFVHSHPLYKKKNP